MDEKKKEGEFCYASDSYSENFVGGYATREAARADAIDAAKAHERTTIITARSVPYSAATFLPEAKDILETMHEQAHGEVGEHAEDWPDVSREGREALDKLLAEWAEKYVDDPSFFGVEDEEEEDIDEDEA